MTSDLFNGRSIFGFIMMLCIMCWQSTSYAQAASDSSLGEKILDKVLDKPDRDSIHVYSMNYWRSAAFSAAATAANIYAIPNLIKAKKPLTDMELTSLNRDAIHKWDRWVLDQDPGNRENIDRISDKILTATVIGGAGVFLDKKIRKDWFRVAVMYVEVQAATFTIYNFSPFGPSFQNKIRPAAYYEELPLSVRKDGNMRNSFYSGHVANAAASAFFLVKVYGDYHPELGRKKYFLYALASVPPLTMSYLRARALFHFPSDCVTGFLVGATAGIIIPEAHKLSKRKNLKNLDVSVVTPAGPGVSLTWRLEGKERVISGF
ncbi:MAG: phosphatase PAP2 family protein [Sphingobacteriales bacterium]|nr:MAG: phosphatase PAP2 family protein [Sphingobacteriales bacterium]